MSLRLPKTDDALNSASGGCAAGLFAGARGSSHSGLQVICPRWLKCTLDAMSSIAGSFPVGVASCIAIATLLGTFDAAGKVCLSAIRASREWATDMLLSCLLSL